MNNYANTYSASKKLHYASISMLNIQNTLCPQKSGTPSSINNYVNFQWIFKILLLADSLNNLQQNYH